MTARLSISLKQYIRNLNAHLAQEGDLELTYSADDEGNSLHRVLFTPSVMYILKDNKHYRHLEYISEPEYLELDRNQRLKYKKVLCIN